VLKAAHSFNLLDARGAISVTERAAYIGRIRNLARSVAQSYYESRERLGFPLAPREWVEQMTKKASDDDTDEQEPSGRTVCRRAAAQGLEEARRGLRQRAVRAAQGAGPDRSRLGQLTPFASPRRLAVHITHVASQAPPTRPSRKS
jgi:hypothetical protein